MSEKLDLASVFSRGFEAFMNGFFVASVGKVKAYNSNDDTINVEPLSKRYVEAFDPDEEKGTFEKLPLIYNVPIVRPRAGDFFISLPVQVDDTVLLIATNEPIDKFISTNKVFEAADKRKNHVNNCVAIPSILAQNKRISKGSETNLVIGNDQGVTMEIQQGKIKMSQEGGITLEFDASTLKVNGQADAAALATRVKALETAFLTFVQSHTHPYASPAAATGPVVPGSWGAYQAQDFASTVLKVGS